jgi:hypothetical protein
MSSKGYFKTFEGAATPTGAVVAKINAENLNWLSFQLKPLLAGTVNITFTIEESNDDIDYIQTLTTKNYTTTGTKNDMLSVSQATSKYYRVKVTITTGTITSYQVVAVGKG